MATPAARPRTETPVAGDVVVPARGTYPKEGYVDSETLQMGNVRELVLARILLVEEDPRPGRAPAVAGEGGDGDDQ